MDIADGFLISDAYLSYIHDDCIQNDELGNGTLTNSFFDGHLNTWAISNSLIRLQAMPTVYKGTAAGHGGFFKWDTTGRGPMLDISNTIFRADQIPNHQDLNLPAGYNVTCSNNTMVWLGQGAFPGSLPSCFTVTMDWSMQATGSATPGSDYTTRSGTTKIAFGVRMVTVAVPILAYTAPETSESFNVVVNGATNATLFKATGTVTIYNDD